MDPILKASNVNFHTENGAAARSIRGYNENPFSKELMLSKADELLRNTTQYEKWKKLCQRNGDTASEVADLILKRNAILEQSKISGPVDWSAFDALTQKLKTHDISLLDSSEIYRQNKDSETSKLQNINAAKIVSLPTHNIKQEKSEDLPTQEIDPAVTSTEDAPFKLSDESYLLLNLNYGKNILGENIVGYGDLQNLFLPLGELSRTLDFSINTDADKGTAKGWFISEGRTFNLDLTKMEVMVDGKKEQIPEKSVMVADDDLYVDSKLLSKWFPVDFNFDYSKQSIGIEPREKLPFQNRMEREQGWDISRRRNSNDTKFPREKSEYDFLGPQFVDINVGASYTKNTRNGDQQTDSNFNLLSRGDLAKMSSEIYLAGNSRDNLNDARFTLERVDPDKNLLGPLKATSIAAGDISPPRLPEIGGSTREKGISISNKEMNRSSDFDTTFFEGSLLPGWDVEVYRNDSLMASKRVGEDGKYYFGDMPIYYGKNDYKLVFYGPQGQKRIETKSIDVDSNVLKKGRGEYNISLTQKNTDVYDPEKQHYRDMGTSKVDATFDLGINEKLSMGVGISSQEVESDRHNYLNLNAKGSYKNIRLRGDYIKDTQGGDAITGLAQTQVKGVDLNLKQKVLNDLRNNNYLQTDIAASGIIRDLSFLPDLRSGLFIQDLDGENFHETSVGSSIATNIDNTKLSNYLNLRKTSNDSGDSTSLNGNFQISSEIKDLRIGGSLDYDIKPETEITAAELSGTYNITDNLSSSVNLKKTMQEDEDFEGTLKLNWNRNNGKFIISPSVSYDTDDNFKAMLNFSTSLGIDPKTKKINSSSTPMGENGMALINVYQDKNNNSIFDQGDEIIKGATVKAVQSHIKAETDADGDAVFTGLRNYLPTDILVDKATLEDPFWEPKIEGVSIVPRPAHIHDIFIPVIETGEIDGTVYREMKDGTEIPFTNVRMQLTDEKGNVVQETRSKYDGFYLFEKIPLGNYQVRVDPLELEKKGLGEVLLSDMNIKTEDNVLSGNNLHLALLSKETKPEGTVEKPLIAAKMENTESAEAIPKTTVGVAQTDKTDPKGTTAYTEPSNKPDVIIPAGGPDKVAVKEPTSLGATGEPKVAKAVPEMDSAKTAPGPSVGVVQTDKTDQKETTAHTESAKKTDGIIPAAVPVKEGVKAPTPSLEAADEPKVDKAVPKKDVARAAAEKTEAVVPHHERFGVHLSSYRTSEKAIAGIDDLRKKYKNILGDAEFTVKRVHVSDEKGTWYRVFAGVYDDKEKAEQLKNKIKMAEPYCRVLSLGSKSDAETNKGVHLTSFRTTRKAKLSIQELKEQYPVILKNADFTIKSVDLGPEKGKWERVIAGNFSNEADAKRLAKRIKMNSPYGKTMQVEENEEFGVHLASFKTCEKASRGLKILQKKFSSTLNNDDFSIRRVDLGEKGIWYRIFSGRFKDENSAVSTMNSLKSMKQYARIVNLSNQDILNL